MSQGCHLCALGSPVGRPGSKCCAVLRLPQSSRGGRERSNTALGLGCEQENPRQELDRECRREILNVSRYNRETIFRWFLRSRVSFTFGSRRVSDVPGDTGRRWDVERLAEGGRRRGAGGPCEDGARSVTVRGVDLPSLEVNGLYVTRLRKWRTLETSLEWKT